MSEEQIKGFLEKVKVDTSLQEKLKAASDADAVLAIAKEAGFSISGDDLEKAHSELSEVELEGVAGGYNPGNTCQLYPQSNCVVGMLGVTIDGQGPLGPKATS